MAHQEAPNTRPCWSQTTKLVVSIFLVLLLALAVYVFRIVFTPLVIGGILAYLLYPVVRTLSRLTRLPHGAATGIIYLLLLAIAISVGASLAPLIVSQVLYLQREFMRFLAYLNSVSQESVFVMGLEIQVEEITSRIVAALTDIVTSFATESVFLVFDVAETFLLTIFVVLIAFYLTRDSDKFADFLRGLIPLDYRHDVNLLAKETDRIWAAFFRGQLILAAVVAVIITTMCSVIGLPQPVLMGVLAGLLEFLPSVGHAIWVATAVVIALIEGSTHLPISNFAFALLIIGLHFIFTQTDLNFLIPRIIGRQVHLHPMVVILGIIIGAVVGGVLGIALAAPTIATLRVLGRYVYARLLDIDPFPMVGPVAVPPEKRLACVEENVSEQAALAVPGPRELIQRIRRSERRDEHSHE